MATKSQLKAASAHRRRAASRGMVRIEVQAAGADAGLIRAVAEKLRGKPEEATALRAAIEKTLVGPTVKDVFDAISIDVSGAEFDDIFDQPREIAPPPIEL